MAKIQRCKKCGAHKGSTHRSGCAARYNPSAYPEATLYTTTYGSGDSGSSASSPSSGSSCDSASSSSSSDSGSSGGGGCE